MPVSLSYRLTPATQPLSAPASVFEFLANLIWTVCSPSVMV